jgi:hypothetical protein
MIPWRGVLTSVMLIACAEGTEPPPLGSNATRSYRMGFSGFPPAPDLQRAAAAVLQWIPRADAAIIHAEPQWSALLSGESPAAIVRREYDGLVATYRSRNLELVVVIDVTNGVDRTAESAPLVAARRSITEPAVQALYRAWVRAMVSQLQPVALGLAAETNLIRLAAPVGVYNAIKQMTADAARDVRTDAPALPLFITINVETAWGRLQGTNQYIGIEEDFRDFPFTQWMGLSSYPYLGRFNEPAEVPDDWYTRPLNGRSVPTVITEGGWTSASVGTVVSSATKQAQWIDRQMQLADRLQPRYLFQLLYTDLDLVAFQRPNDPQLLPFARLGLVDMTLVPKVALARWDTAFARRYSR